MKLLIFQSLNEVFSVRYEKWTIVVCWTRRITVFSLIIRVKNKNNNFQKSIFQFKI